MNRVDTLKGGERVPGKSYLDRVVRLVCDDAPEKVECVGAYLRRSLRVRLLESQLERKGD